MCGIGGLERARFGRADAESRDRVPVQRLELGVIEPGCAGAVERLSAKLDGCVALGCGPATSLCTLGCGGRGDGVALSRTVTVPSLSLVSARTRL